MKLKSGSKSVRSLSTIEKLQRTLNDMEGCSDEELFKKFYETSESFREIVKSYTPEEKAPEPTVTMTLSEYERLKKTQDDFEKQNNKIIEVRGQLSSVQEALKDNIYVCNARAYSSLSVVFVTKAEAEKVLKAVLETLRNYNAVEIK